MHVYRPELNSTLTRLVRAIQGACDNAVEDGEDGTSLDRRDYEAICAELDKLDLLPEPGPHVASEAGAKVEYWLRHASSEPDTNAFPRSQGGDGLG